MKKTNQNNVNSGQGLEQLIHLVSLPESKSNNETGIFKGKVVEADTDARVFGVVVELVGAGRTYITSPSGYFKLTDVPEGVYLARFSVPGFKEVSEVVAIVAGESLNLTLALEVK